MSYILKLAGWYPSRKDLFTGDFVQRHAQSIALYEKVIVLYLMKDTSVKDTLIDVRVSDDGRLTEYLVYYAAGGVLGRGVSVLRYLLLGMRMVQRIKKEHGEPMLVHVNIVWKAGLLALWLKRKYGWDYLITENWTGYTTASSESLYTQGRLMQKIFQRIYRNCRLFLPVSRDLAMQVKEWFGNIPYEVVYNVVNTELFYPPADMEIPAVKKGIHVSTMGYQKNIEGILRVLEQLLATRHDVEITLVGPYTSEIKQVLSEKGLLDKKVFLTGERSYAEVALLMQQSHFLFLFSRYENLPCVMLEALCCGLPVIATRVGGVPEIIDESNGLLVDSERDDQLLQALHVLLESYARYDRPAIAQKAKTQFSYAVIGRQFSDIYKRYSRK